MVAAVAVAGLLASGVSARQQYRATKKAEKKAEEAEEAVLAKEAAAPGLAAEAADKQKRALAARSATGGRASTILTGAGNTSSGISSAASALTGA